ncbi:MAG: patatin-like phospholipase family protein [Acidimicrobiales bacterium]
MTQVGLVLGAGGIVGQAYHAGVLAALELDLGWDPRTADVIVGSSAGSITGTALRLGVPAHDLAAVAADSPLSAEGSALLEALGRGTPLLPPFNPRDVLRGWRLPSAALLARVARRPWAFRPAVAAVTCLPPGRVDISVHATALDALAGGDWPEGLWICAVRRDDGARVTFGRAGAPPARLAQAVAASCAIPGYFSPIEIGDVEYVDGGVHSSTNADVLRDAELDVVVVVAPMSSVHGRVGVPDAALRWSAHSRLEREIRRLRARGTEVVRFEPGARTLRVMGVNAMADNRNAAVAREAFLDAGAFAATSRVSRRLARLATRASRQVA